MNAIPHMSQTYGLDIKPRGVIKLDGASRTGCYLTSGGVLLPSWRLSIVTPRRLGGSLWSFTILSLQLFSKRIYGVIASVSLCGGMMPLLTSPEGTICGRVYTISQKMK